MSEHSAIVWFRLDLRRSDNPALAAAIASGAHIIPVYIYDPAEQGKWAPGAASRWFLHYALASLEESLAKQGMKLIYRRGSALENLRDIVNRTDAAAVYFNRRYESLPLRQDLKVQKMLAEMNVECRTFNSALLVEPDKIRTAEGTPYKIFTPFHRAFGSRPEPDKPVPETELFQEVEHRRDEVQSLSLDEFRLLPTYPWDAGLRATWSPGEADAQQRLREFSEQGLDQYDTGRDRPDLDGVSKMSPYLHFGCIGPRQIWHFVRRKMTVESERGFHSSCETYLKELVWREFAHYLLFHFPESSEVPLRAEFSHFPWHHNERSLRAWQNGRTGYPIVDAGMRELWHTGWMHNRVRMIVASFLVKHLLLPWTDGAEWFWDTLVDADLANNTLGWQWSAGCGSDAAPYFRIFNPILQGKKFDPQGDYVRKWVPELENVPDRWLHNPFEAPAAVLHAANLQLGTDYSCPLVDHKEAREKALSSFASLRNARSASL